MAQEKRTDCISKRTYLRTIFYQKSSEDLSSSACLADTGRISVLYLPFIISLKAKSAASFRAIFPVGVRGIAET